MSWSRREQSGWTIELFEPPQPRPSAGLLFLPGHSGKTLINNPAWTQSLEQARLRAACPISGSGWWVEAGERIAGQAPLAWLYEQVVPALRDWWQLDQTAIAVAGVSLGAQGALGLAYRHAREFPVVAAISPAVDFHELHDGIVRDTPVLKGFVNRFVGVVEMNVLADDADSQAHVDTICFVRKKRRIGAQSTVAGTVAQASGRLCVIMRIIALYALYLFMWIKNNDL